jgi:RNA polymerase sigma-70 factor, ECF subfamily
MAGKDVVDLGDLAVRAGRHEPAAFAELFDLFFERLRRYAFYQTGDIDGAEDIAADVIRAAIESIDRFDDRGGMLGAWLYGIARNLIARQFREQGRKPEVRMEDAPVLSGGEALEDTVLRGLTYVELYDAISRLPDEQREVIILRYIEGYRSKTVAEIVQKKPGAVRAIQHRAILALKRALAPGAMAAAAAEGAGGLETSDGN